MDQTVVTMEELMLSEKIKECLEGIDLQSGTSKDVEERVKMVQELMPLLTELKAQESKATHDREMEEIEREKQKMRFSKVILELLKIGVPTIIPLMVWRVSFKEMMKFEETGRFVSTASKELHLPKIFK